MTDQEGKLDTSPYYRNYSYTLTNQIIDGKHTIQLISTDKDGKTFQTKAYTIYGYTAVEPSFTRYPASKNVKILSNPSSQTGTLLSLKDKLTVIGTFGTNLYYVYLNGDTDSTGYVNRNEVVSEQVIDWSTVSLDVLTWQKTSNPDHRYEQYATSNSYGIDLKWFVNTALPGNYGYNLYLVPIENGNTYFRTVKLNDSIIYGDKYTINSGKLDAVFPSNSLEETAEVYLRVDLVHSWTGEVKLSAFSTDFCTILSRIEADKIRDSVYTAAKRISGPHDLLYKGSATVDGQTFTCRTVKQVTGIGKYYSSNTGDLKDVYLTPITQGALLAESIMDQVARTKLEPEPDINKTVKTALSWIGFDLDVMLQLEKNDKNAALEMLQYNKKLASRSDIADSSLDEFYNKYFEKLKLINNTQDVKFVVSSTKTGLKAANLVTSVLRDYLTYRSVKSSDVEIYIKMFEQSENSAMKNAANYLKVMTGGDQELFGYLLKGYGLNAAKDWAFESVYKVAMSVIPVEFQLEIKGLTLANNLLFNTNKVLEKAYELEVLSEQCEEAKNFMIDYYSTFKNEPVKYYDEMVNRVDVYLSLLQVEMEKFNEFASENEEGAIAKLRNWIAGKEVTQVNVENSMRIYEFLIDNALEQCHAVWVTPFKKT